MFLLSLLKPFYSQNRSSGVSYQRAAGTPKRGQGRLEAKSCRFDEELQSQNTPPENIFFYRISGGPEGTPLGSPCCHFCSIFIGKTVTSGAVLSLLRLFYSQKRLFEAFLSLRPPFYSQRCPVGGRFWHFWRIFIVKYTIFYVFVVTFEAFL